MNLLLNAFSQCRIDGHGFNEFSPRVRCQHPPAVPTANWRVDDVIRHNSRRETTCPVNPDRRLWLQLVDDRHYRVVQNVERIANFAQIQKQLLPTRSDSDFFLVKKKQKRQRHRDSAKSRGHRQRKSAMLKLWIFALLEQLKTQSEQPKEADVRPVATLFLKRNRPAPRAPRSSGANGAAPPPALRRRGTPIR